MKMRLFQINEQYPIGPPEFVGETMYLVLAENESEALKVAKVSDSRAKVKEIETCRPMVILTETL